MEYSTREQIAHVFRRLGIGGHPDLVDRASDPNEAIAQALDLSNKAQEPPDIEAPTSGDAADQQGLLRDGISFWIDAMLGGTRLIEERLVWFWHDHFATNVRKVRFPYLMWTQHLTLRRHARGSFADLLHAIATDPAMLFYLDGTQNQVGALNENFGREVMELYTLGIGAYTQEDVVAAARSFSGWVVAVPREGRPFRIEAEPWASVFIPIRHDAGEKTLLGRTGNHDAGDAIDILLDHPLTAETVAAKLYRHLTGLNPSGMLVVSLANTFRADYSIMALVEAIVADQGFLSADAIRSKVRTPLEKTVGLMQGFPVHDRAAQWAAQVLDTAQYIPFQPPNPAGFPDGPRLLDPYRLVHGFDVAGVVDPRSLGSPTTDALFARLGIHDLSPTSRAVVDGRSEPLERLALAVNSPEFALS